MSTSSAGRAVSSNGCVTRPKGRENGLHSCAVQIPSSLLIGSYVMETAEQREPYESRGSRTVLGEPGGESPPGHSTIPDGPRYPRHPQAVAPQRTRYSARFQAAGKRTAPFQLRFRSGMFSVRALWPPCTQPSYTKSLPIPRAGLAALTDVVILAGITRSRPSSRMGEETRRDPPNPPNKHPHRRPRGRPRSAPYAGGTPRAGSAYSPPRAPRLGIQHPRQGPADRCAAGRHREGARQREGL